jgi:hypothetical protein
MPPAPWHDEAPAMEYVPAAHVAQSPAPIVSLYVPVLEASWVIKMNVHVCKKQNCNEGMMVEGTERGVRREGENERLS